MKKSTFSALSALLLAFLAAPVSFGQDATFPPVPSAPTVAHRGFSFAAPENTLSAVQKAIEIGAQGCEFDIYRSADGVIYLLHDGNLKRTAGVDLKPGDATFAQLQTLDFSADWKKSDEYKGEKVATYNEALALLKHSGCRPVVEVKASGFETEVVDALRRFDLIETAIVIDFNAERVKKMREYEPKLCVAWLCSFKVENETPESMANKIIATLKEAKTNVVDVQYAALSPEFLKILDDAGIEVMRWTVDAPADVERVVAMGVKSVTTNRPDLVLEAQKKFNATK